MKPEWYRFVHEEIEDDETIEFASLRMGDLK